MLLNYSSASATVADVGHGMTPLMCACQHADVDLISLLLNCVSNVTRTAYLSTANRFVWVRVHARCGTSDAQVATELDVSVRDTFAGMA